MQPLRILLLSDTRPGHYRLSEGIAAAVARLWPVDVCRVETRRPRWLGEPLALATNLGVPPALLLRRVFGVEPTSLLPADLIISAGSETLAGNVALARLGHVPNIFYGSLRRFQPGDFTLALSSYRRAGMAANQLVALKPSALDPDVAVPLAWPEPHEAGRPRRAINALILGGPAPGFAWSVADWDSLFELIVPRTGDGPAWIVANSRRTPAAVSDRFRDAVSQAGSQAGTRLRFIDVRVPGAPSLDGVLALAALVVVTADSSSMVSEAIWARRPVIAVRPSGAVMTADEAVYRQWLVSERWVADVGIAELSPDTLGRIAAPLRPLETNPQAALAGLISRHIPSLFQSVQEPATR